MDEKFNKVVTKLDDLSSKDKCFGITYGQITAIAASPIGQSIGLTSILNDDDREIIL